MSVCIWYDVDGRDTKLVVADSQLLFLLPLVQTRCGPCLARESLCK